MNRLLLMKIHSLLAAFMLPVAIMFMLTGALYTWGVKGSYSNETHEVNLEEPLSKNFRELRNLTIKELDRLRISYPEGDSKIKVAGNHYYLEWNGSSRDVTLEPTENENVASLTIKETSLYRSFVQLHKAKGGVLFKVYAAIFSVAIGVLLISGFIMAWRTPKLKQATLITFCAGILSFIILVWLS